MVFIFPKKTQPHLTVGGGAAEHISNAGPLEAGNSFLSEELQNVRGIELLDSSNARPDLALVGHEIDTFLLIFEDLLHRKGLPQVPALLIELDYRFHTCREERLLERQTETGLPAQHDVGGTAHYLHQE